jgi:DNA-binding LacI/PurR family transcriptional regulator
MRDAGQPAPREFVVACPVDDESVFRATRGLLSREDRPTALIVWSPTAAVPALAAARESGLRLPHELSLVAYNDSPVARYLEPPLTTVHMPLEEMSTTAVDSLLRIIDGGHPRNRVTRTAPVLVERGSTGPPERP